ncbi:MAG: hypothetical protein K6C68_04105 [Ruminococcus sp.]|nr:hypothetical protein [Ruminococcus sp.]
MGKGKIIAAGLVSVPLIAGGTFAALSRYTKNFNKTFPEKYIAETYPDAEILSYGYEDGFFLDKGRMTYKCREKSTGILFVQTFKETVFLHKYLPGESSYERARSEYERARSEWEGMNELTDFAEQYVKAEHFIIKNPLRTPGIVIITKGESAENIDSLMKALNDEIRTLAGKHSSPNPLYLVYTIIDCTDGLYEKMQTVDWKSIYSGKSGQCDFFDIARSQGWEHERITAEFYVSELNIENFENRGDPADEDYKDPAGFTDTAVCIIGAIGHQDQWEFGVNI